MKFLIAIVMGAGIASCATSPSAGSSPMRLLFIGNSFTYWNDLPAVISEMARLKDKARPLSIQSVTADGASLDWHWRTGTVQGVIASQPWDVVVLQEQGMLPLVLPDRYAADVRKFDAAIRGRNAKTALYMTWASKDSGKDHDKLVTTIARVGAGINATVVPVAIPWRLALERGVALFDKDGVHPSPAGTYLIACVFLRKLAAVDPTGLPPVIKSASKTLIDLDPSLAALLQELSSSAADR